MAEASTDKPPTPVPTPRACHVAHAWLRTPVYRELEFEAGRRRMHPDVLTAEILDRVIREGWIDTLLDDARL